jgi:signal transduction histidine kinase
LLSYLNINQDSNDNSIEISIADNGGGIPVDLVDKIFEPYFTTKFKSQGTGIGLYMSKMIVENSMHGILKVENIDGGARFIIRIT